MSLERKKSSKICFLRARKCGKRPSCQWKPSAAESSCCGFLPRQQTPLKEKLLPTQILFAFTPKNKLCAWRRHGRARSSWRGLQQGNSSVKATENWFSLSISKLPFRKTRQWLPSPCTLAPPTRDLPSCKTSLFQVNKPRDFLEARKKKNRPDKCNTFLCNTFVFGVILRASEVQV